MLLSDKNMFLLFFERCTDRLRSRLDEGGAVKNFVEALQQLTNPDMIFRVMRETSHMNSIKLPRFGFWADTVFIWSSQDWWDSVKIELEKPAFNKKRMADMYEEMRSMLGDRNASSHGIFRKKFIQVCHFLFVSLSTS